MSASDKESVPGSGKKKKKKGNTVVIHTRKDNIKHDLDQKLIENCFCYKYY